MVRNNWNRSKSQTYEALRVFMPEAEAKYQTLQDDLVEAKKILEDTGADVGQANEERQRATEEVESLSEEKEQLAEEVNGLREKYGDLKSDMAELEKRGFTPTIVRKLANIEERSGRKVLRQIRKAENYKKMVEDSSRQEKENMLLEKEIVTNRNLKKGLENEIEQLDIVYDDLRVRTLTYSDAVQAVEELFHDGYSVDDLQSIRYGLRQLRIKGEPQLSVKRLVDELLTTKSRYVLKKQVKEAETQLQEVKEELDILKQKRNSIEEGIVQSFSRIGQEFVQKIVESRKTDMEVYGFLKQQSGKLGENVNYGHAFFGFMNSDDLLVKCPPSVVAELLSRAALWCRIKYPGILIRPPQEMCDRDSYLNTFSRYRVDVLCDLASYGVRCQASKLPSV